MGQTNSLNKRQQLEYAIAAQEQLRGTLDDATIDATIAALQEVLNQLDAWGQIEQQKKQVTLLFMDIVGSTNIVRDLDPEDNLSIMEGALECLSKPAEEQGGHVTRYMGDGFIVIFGHLVARENDPERAVQAGLDILHAAEEFKQELSRQWGIHDFAVRVGINTGLVVLGGQSEGEDTIAGAAVNLAARIESAAEPGTVLISHHTQQHVQGAFDVEPRQPIRAKGFDEPQAVYKVVRAKQRTFHSHRQGIEGVEIPMIGRETEMITLQDAFYAAIEDCESGMVTIVGEAGIGKSRLTYEFEKWVAQNFPSLNLFHARASIQYQAMPYGLLRELLTAKFEIKDDDPTEVVREKFTAGIRAALGNMENSDRKAHFIGQLVGFDFSDSPHLQDVLENPQVIRDRAIDSLVDHFTAISGREGTVVLLDDLHWSDDSSLDVLNQLMVRLSNQPILFVAAARGYLFERRQHWGEGQESHLRLDLHPLTKRNSRLLVGEALRQVPDIPASLRDLVINKAGGNPFYVEELIKILVDDGVIIKDEPAWRLDLDRLAEIRVPTTLIGVLQARLERLPKVERTVLGQASIVGRVFWDTLILQINQSGMDGQDEKTVQEALSALREKEVVFRRETSVFSGVHEYIFKHSMLREVAYESVLKRLRQDYHRIVAEWLIVSSHDREGEFLGLIADHLVKAGHTQQALGYLLRGGQEAAARYANKEALLYLDQAVILADKSTFKEEELYSLYRLRGLIHERLGVFEAARKEFETSLRLASAAGDLHREWRARIDLGKHWASRDYSKTRDYFEGALELARQLDDPALVAHSLNRMGNWYANADRPQEAIRYHHEALTIFEGLEDRSGLAGTLDLLGTANTIAGDFLAHKVYFDRAIELFREMDDKQGLASSLTLRGAVGPLYEFHAVIRVESMQEGRRYSNNSLQILHEIDQRSGMCPILWGEGLIAATSGRYGEALENLEYGLSVATEIGHRQFMAMILSGLGILYSYLLAGEKAKKYAEQALELSKQVQSKYWTQLAAGTLANAYLLMGEPALGQVYLEQEFDNQTSMQTSGNRYCWCRRAELALAQNEPAVALKILDRVIASTPGLSPGRVNSSLWRLRGEALLELGRLDEAEVVLLDALEFARSFEEEYIIWRIHGVLGGVYHRTDRHAQAKEAFEQARKVVEKQAATIPDEELRGNFLIRANEALGPSE